MSRAQPLALEWMGLARAARSGRPEEAIYFLEAALKSDPRPETQFNLGAFLTGRGRTEEAIALYERVLAARPNLAAAWSRLGDAHRECGNVRAAIDAYRRAVAIDPAQKRYAAALIDALEAFGDKEEAGRERQHEASG